MNSQCIAYRPDVDDLHAALLSVFQAPEFSTKETDICAPGAEPIDSAIGDLEACDRRLTLKVFKTVFGSAPARKAIQQKSLGKVPHRADMSSLPVARDLAHSTSRLDPAQTFRERRPNARSLRRCAGRGPAIALVVTASHALGCGSTKTARRTSGSHHAGKDVFPSQSVQNLLVGDYAI
jgi:hypothetical protein